MDSGVGIEAHGGARRSAPELATLLLELARLVKARRYYGPGDARLAAVFERCVRSWLANLERSGALVLEIGPQGFRQAGSEGVLAHERLKELHRELGERGLYSLTFEPDLDAEAFAGFAEVLASDAGLVSQQGGFSAMLTARVPFGIEVVETPARPAPAPEPPEAGAAGADSAEPRVAPTRSEPMELPDLEDQLSGLLRDLGLCDSSGHYSEIARQVATLAERAFEIGDSGGFERVIRTFSDHIEGKQDARIGQLAQSFLAGLASGRRLESLVRHAAQRSETGIHSLRALMLLGDDVVAEVVGMAAMENDRDRQDALFEVVHALGDRALPPIFDLLTHELAEVVCSAARLAGGSQHPASVAKLADTLRHHDSGAREEAARALVRIGSDDAIAALARAARSPEPATISLAVQCLAATHSARALPPLENVLERALDAKDVDRAKQVIRALGRMAEPKAARPLAELLQRRSRLQRWLRDLKVAAITALGSLPGDEAVGALAQAAQFRDAQMRKAAQTALDRRAGTLARG